MDTSWFYYCCRYRDWDLVF